MACLVSISFATPLPTSQTLNRASIWFPGSFESQDASHLININGGHKLESALGRLSSKATLGTAQKALGSCSSNKRILSVNRRCQHFLSSCTRFLSETSSYNLDVDYCTEIVISGYWVGPDADDGWGFVEAVINQMT